MKRFSQKILENRWNKSGKWHTGAWLESWGKNLKDRRSRFVTKTDQKNAFKDFGRMVKAEMKKHPNMSQKDAMDKVLESRAYTTAEEASAKNISKTARKNFGIRVNKNGVQTVNNNTWMITQGPHAGHMLTLQHNPAAYPSYVIVLI